MSLLWLGIAVAAVGCYALKLTGLSVPQRVLAHPVAERVAALIPVALLAALVAVQVLADGQSLALDARPVGLGVAVVLLIARRRSSWWCSRPLPRRRSRGWCDAARRQGCQPFPRVVRLCNGRQPAEYPVDRVFRAAPGTLPPT